MSEEGQDGGGENKKSLFLTLPFKVSFRNKTKASIFFMDSLLPGLLT